MEYIYLHGLGQTAASWQPLLEQLPEKGTCLDLVGLIKGKEATYSNLYAAVSQACDAADDPLVLCGLSLGAVLALNYAIDHPEKVKALVLIATQYKMPKALLALQNVMFHFSRPASKRQILSACARQRGSRISVSPSKHCAAPRCLCAENRTAPIKRHPKPWRLSCPMRNSKRFREQATR